MYSQLTIKSGKSWLTATMVMLLCQGTSFGGIFVDDPQRLWTNGVVNYRIDESLSEVNYCSASIPMVACDDDCGFFDACIALTNGRCLGGDSADNGWPSCDITNGDADCVAAGVSGGQCTITTVAGPCIAMELWSAEANLTFREMNCDNGTPVCPSNTCVRGSPDHYIAWKAWSNTFSLSDSIGQDPDGPQSIFVRLTMNVGAWGMAHELGHALGLYHEQNRRDRGSYIIVYTSNIAEGGLSPKNWDIRPNSQHFPRFNHLVAEPFDFDSLLMYGLCTGSSCGKKCSDSDSCVNNLSTCAPIRRTSPFSGSDTVCGTSSGDAYIGQRNHFSTYDSMTMSFLYPPPGWRFVDQWYDGDEEEGNFPRPFKGAFDGVDATPNNGTLWILPGSYNEVGTIDQPMTIKAPIGPVRIGA